MIDWPGLARGGLWVFGLAGILATLSYAGWSARSYGTRLRHRWLPTYDLAVNAGAFLVALALCLGRRPGWEQWLEGACALGFLALAGYDLYLLRRRGAEGPSPHEGSMPCSAAKAAGGARARLWPWAVLPGSLLAALLLALGRRLAVLAGIGLVLLLWLMGWPLARRPRFRSPLDWPLALLLAMALVGTAISVDRALSRAHLQSLVGGMAIYLALAAWACTRRRLALAVGLWVLMGVGLALLAPLAQTQWMTNKFFQVPEALRLAVLPETIQPNVLAGALVLVLPVALAVLLSRWTVGLTPPSPVEGEGRGGGHRGDRRLRPGLLRLLLGLACGLMLTMLVLSQSRGGWLGLAAGMGLFALLSWRWARYAALPAVAALGLGGYRFGLGRLLELLSTGGALHGLDGRLEVWSRAIYMLQDFAFTGIGLGTYQVIAPLMYPFFLIGPDAIVPHCHNLFLQVGVDLGLPGLVAFLAVLMLCAVMAWQTWRAAREPWLRGLAAGLLASEAALAVHGLVDAAVWGQKPSFLLWMLFGLIVAVWRVTATTTTNSMNGYE